MDSFHSFIQERIQRRNRSVARFDPATARILHQSKTYVFQMRMIRPSFYFNVVLEAQYLD
jgi:hypothetical protein